MLKLFCDGACHVNTGVGGFAYVIVYNDKYRKHSEKVIDTTNNRMELTAVIKGLEDVFNDALLDAEQEIEVLSDSKYVVDAVNKSWLNKWIIENFRNRLNSDLWRKLHKLLKKRKVKFTWIKGHNNDRFNELCDQLAVQASNS